MTTKIDLCGLVRQDLTAMVPPAGAPGARWWLEVGARLALLPRLQAVLLFRLSQWCAARRLPPAALWLHGRVVRIAGAELSPTATIGPGLCLVHSVGVVIGPQVTIGARARVHQNVTLAGRSVIGDDVTLGAGSCVLGGVRIGHRVIVGAHAVVTRDLPDDVIATGVPATARRRDPRCPDRRSDG